MKNTNSAAYSVDCLVEKVVCSARQQQICERENDCTLSRQAVRGDGKYNGDNRITFGAPLRHKSISLKQLLLEEPVLSGASTRLEDVDLPSNDDFGELAAIQGLINSQYALCATTNNDKNDVFDSVTELRPPLPPPPLPAHQHLASLGRKELPSLWGDGAGVDEAPVSACRSRCSVGVQCDARAAMSDTELQQLRRLLPSDPETVVKILAQRIREFEMSRFGHSPPFKSALLQQL